MGHDIKDGGLAEAGRARIDWAAGEMPVIGIRPGQILTDRLIGLAGSAEAARANAREKVPAGRPGTVEELAAVAAFICGEPASYVTGAAIPIDGGMLQGI